MATALALWTLENIAAARLVLCRMLDVLP